MTSFNPISLSIKVLIKWNLFFSKEKKRLTKAVTVVAVAVIAQRVQRMLSKMNKVEKSPCSFICRKDKSKRLFIDAKDKETPAGFCLEREHFNKTDWLRAETLCNNRQKRETKAFSNSVISSKKHMSGQPTKANEILAIKGLL